MKDKAKEKLFLFNVFNQATKSCCCRFHLNLSRVTHTRAFKKFDIEVHIKVNPGTFLPLRIRNDKFITRKKKDVHSPKRDKSSKHERFSHYDGIEKCSKNINEEAYISQKLFFEHW